MLYKIGVEFEACLKMSPLKWDRGHPSKIVIAKEIMVKLQQYQISRY